MREPAGKALWSSLGTLLRNSAARHLQVGPEELRVGMRATPYPDGRVGGEVFIYDTLPGGAGHARSIERELEAIVGDAEREAAQCPNPSCPGACYSCLLSYDNQALHPLLDRHLAADMLAAARGERPRSFDTIQPLVLAERIAPFALDTWTVSYDEQIGGVSAPVVFRNGNSARAALMRPTIADSSPGCANVRGAGILCDSYTEFDVSRRPYWVIQQLAVLT
jgi:hypothetical protein